LERYRPVRLESANIGSQLGGQAMRAVGNAFRQRDLEVRDANSIPTAPTNIIFIKNDLWIE